MYKRSEECEGVNHVSESYNSCLLTAKGMFWVFETV